MSITIRQFGFVALTTIGLGVGFCAMHKCSKDSQNERLKLKEQYQNTNNNISKPLENASIDCFVSSKNAAEQISRDTVYCIPGSDLPNSKIIGHIFNENGTIRYNILEVVKKIKK